ncbi:SMC-Scp complex subunit ScpB [Alicyclobacillus sp. ALC3]|uniref:SMC-Scp complex subunit ScpB n=1 Tax=Alicyclobacillus sp. ALC3 TaxID=2796143 RepID=UPI0023796912|nr:SMC-Scp complex subunit ScpB [Alicyclobacillus sp. ALC3]WDL97098.1 SMC-Scp complex subunit ScpB [Alicyclobacillus sp. ALC3]
MTLLPIAGALESILFAAGSDGLRTDELIEILQLDRGQVLSLCQELSDRYDKQPSGLQLVELAGHWKLTTRPEHAVYLERMATSPTISGLSQAALEVLAIVAYRQPISRADIESVRGVQSDRAVATLVHRRMIVEVGRQESPGRPILYGTTDYFLHTFGLRNLSELPPLPDEPEPLQDLALFQLGDTLARD